MELKDYLGILRRRWLMIVAITLLVTGAAAGVTFLMTPQYTSSVKLFITTSANEDSNSALQSGQYGLQRVTSYVDQVTDENVAGQVIDRLGLEVSESELVGRVEATNVPQTVNIVVTVTDTSPSQAQALAQTYGEVMEDRVRALETTDPGATPPIKASIVNDAVLPSSPSSPQPVRNIGLGLVLGLLLSFGLAVLREVLDTTVKSPADLAGLDTSVLGTIPFDPQAKKRSLVSDLAPHAPRAEAFRVLRTNLQFVDIDASNKVYVVTSALPGEGKTSTSVNLALTLAQAGTRTLLVECDLRRPKAAASLGLDSAVGVTTSLVGRIAWKDAVQQVDGVGLDVLAAGAVPPNPAELLQSKAMATLLDEVRAIYDVVIFDAPPLLPVVDAAVIASQVDGALLVTKFGSTTHDQVGEAKKRLDNVDAHLSGVLLNMTPTSSRRYGYGYGYGYGYAPETADQPKRRKEAKD